MSRSNVSVLRRLGWRLCLAGGVALLAACGGADDPVVSAPATPGTTPPLVGNHAPVAAFSVADRVAAGAPLPLDATASSDADGDALLYHWDFGDGTLGGGRQIAHVFTTGGSYTVRLTVDDGRGGSHSVLRQIGVDAAPAPLVIVDTQVRARALDGSPLSGVSVSLVGGNAGASTDSDGRATLRSGTGVAAVLKLSKPGYSDQFRDVELPAGAESGFVDVAMMPRQSSLTLADAAVGGTLQGKDGATVVFEANALVDAAGNLVSGPVSVSMTPVDVAANQRAFPGRFAGVRSSGASGLLMSYGAVEFVLEAGGQPVQLAPGRKARILIPVYTRLHRDGRAMAVGDTSPLWSLDQRTGDWVEEGSGTVIDADTPSGFALSAEVQHFSWWNHDDFVNPPGRPKPRCKVDTNMDGVLEDLTGTGYCWHAGTGPEQEEREQPARARALDAEPRTLRAPAFAVWAATPAAGGVALPIAPDTDITFRSYAKNGTLFGTKVVRLGPNEEREVEILLQPVQSIDGTTAISLPYDNTVMMAVSNEVDRFTFDAEANASYDVVVSAAGLGSSFGGSVTVRGANGATLINGSFATAASTTTVLATSSGQMTIDVAAARGTPGAYRIQVRKLAGAGCTAPATLSLPGSASNIAIAGNAQGCFDLALAPDDVVQITATGAGSIANRLAVFSSAGVQWATTPFAHTAGSPDGVLRLAAAQADTVRVVLTNSNNFAGSVSQLRVERIALAGTLTAPNSLNLAGASTGADNARFYLVKPGSAAPVAATLTATGNHFMRSWPDGQVVSTVSAASRVLSPTAGLSPLIEVGRQLNSAAWNFTLAVAPAMPMPLNTDVAASTPAPGALAVWRVDALAGQQLSIGHSRPGNVNINPVPRLYGPNLGAELVADSKGIYSLPSQGAYTLTVSNATTEGAPYTLRLNDVAAAEFVTLGTLFERSGNLALGEVKRYTFNVALAQLLALRLSSSGSLDAGAFIEGGSIRNPSVSLVSGVQSGRSVASPALYVRDAGVGTLVLSSSSHRDGNSSGPFSLQLQSPAALPANLGAAFSTTVQGGVLKTYAYDIGSAGKYLLCSNHAGDGSNPLDSIVWGPSAPAGASWNRGDIATSSPNAGSPFVEDVGELRAGRNTLSLLSRVPAASATTQRLVALPAPTDIAVGGSSGALALAPCERRYLRFAGTAGTNYTLRVTADFSGNVHVRKQPAVGGDWTSRSATLGGTPQALAAGVERVVNFTIPASGSNGGDGTYVIEVDGIDIAAGNVAVTLSSP